MPQSNDASFAESIGAVPINAPASGVQNTDTSQPGPDSDAAFAKSIGAAPIGGSGSTPAPTSDVSDDAFARSIGAVRISNVPATVPTYDSDAAFARSIGAVPINGPLTQPKSDSANGGKSLWQEINEPLSERLGLPATWSRPGAGPVESGIEKGVTGFATGLTSPVSLGLMAVTGGLSGLAEGAGSEILSSLSPEAAAALPRAARVVSQLAGYGFSGQQLYGAIHSVAPLRVAIKNGDVEAATQIATQALLGGAIGGLSAAHQLAQGFDITGKDRVSVFGPDKEAIGSYQREVETHNVKARNFEHENKALLEDKPLDMAARLYHEAAGNQATLDKWGKQIAATSGIKPEVRAKYAGYIELAKRLPQDHPEVVALSQKLRDDYATDWETAKAAQKIDPSKPGALNYAGQHSYDPADENESSIRPATGHRVTKSPSFLRKRSFETIPEAIKAGFVPKDVGLVAARADYIRKFGTMKGAIEAENSMMNSTAPDGRPVAVGPNQVRTIGGKRVLYLGTDKAPKAVVWNSDEMQRDTFPGYEPGGHIGKVQQVDIRQLEPSEKSDPAQVAALKKQLLKDPSAVPPIIAEFSHDKDGADMLSVVDGHNRLEAARQLGIKNVPVNIHIPADDWAQVNQAAKSQGLSNPFEVRPLPQATEAAPAQLANVSKYNPSQILRKSGKVYLDISDYQQAKPDTPFQRYKFLANGEDGEPIFEKRPDLVHPGYADTINRAFDNTSYIRQTPLLNGLLKTSSAAKASLLSMSPFHWTTEFLRGLQMGLTPWEALNPAPLTEDRPAVSVRTKYGLTLLGDTAARQMSAEGLASTNVFQKVPGLGPIISDAEDSLFGSYIPRLKAAVWESVDRQLEHKLPTTDPAVRHAMASKIVNSAFGGLNWKQLGVSMGSRDALRLLFLAPDFSGAQLLFAKYGAEHGTSGVVTKSLMRILAYNVLAAQTLNLLLNGKVNLDNPLAVQDPQNPDKSISVRTMPSDIWHALTDPRGFAMNRLNPLTVIWVSHWFDQ